MESDSTSSYSGSFYSDYSYSSGSYGAYSATGALGDTFSFNLDQAFSTLEESWKPSSFGNTGLGTIDLSAFGGGATSPTSFNLLDSFSAPSALPAVIEFTPAPELAPMIPALPAVVAPQAVAAPDPVPSTAPEVDIPADLPVSVPQVISQALPGTPDSAPVASEPAPAEAVPQAQPVTAPTVTPAAPNIWADHYIETAVEEGSALPAAPLQQPTAQESVAQGISAPPNSEDIVSPQAVAVPASLTAVPAANERSADEPSAAPQTAAQDAKAEDGDVVLSPVAPQPELKAVPLSPLPPEKQMVVAKAGDTLWKYANGDVTVIGDLAIRNHLKNSTIIAGKDYDITPMDRASLSAEEIQIRDKIGEAYLKLDNARLAALAEAARVREQAAQAARQTETKSQLNPVFFPFNSGPAEQGSWRANLLSQTNVNDWQNGSANAADRPLPAASPAQPKSKASASLLDKLETTAASAWNDARQWIQEHPRTMGTLQVLGGVAETGASVILAAGGTVTTATGVGAPVGVPLQALGWAGAWNGVDNIWTGARTIWNASYQPTVTQQLAVNAATSMGASPETAETVQTVVGFGQFVLGAGALGQAALLKPLTLPPVKATATAEPATEWVPINFAAPAREIEMSPATGGNLLGPTNRVQVFYDAEGRAAEFSNQATAKSSLTSNNRPTSVARDQSMVASASGKQTGQDVIGGHFEPRSLVGDDLGRVNIGGEVNVLKPVGPSKINAGEIDKLAAEWVDQSQAGNAGNTATFNVKVQRNATNLDFSPDTVTKEAVLVDANGVPVRKITETIDNRAGTVAYDVVENPPMTNPVIPDRIVGDLPLSLRIRAFERDQQLLTSNTVDEARNSTNLPQSKIDQKIRSAYSNLERPQGQIAQLRKSDLMPSEAEMTNLSAAERETAIAARIQQIAEIRVRIAETDIRNATNAAVPDPAKIQAAQDKLANATKLVEFLAQPKP